MRLAFDAFFHSAASSSRDEIGALFTAYWTDTSSAFSPPADISIAISLAPAGPGALAIRMEPPVIPVCIDPDRREALIGPLYMPSRSVCPECLDYWLGVNFFDRQPRGEAPAAETLRPLAEAVARLAHSPTQLQLTHAQVIRLGDGHVEHHAVFPRRDCPRCGALSRDDLPLHIHCSAWTGIVNQMELSAAPAAGSYRAKATWSSPLPLNGARGYLQRQHSYGRGRTALDARQGCIGEALERYSLIYRGDEPLIRAPLTDVDAIHPDGIQLFSNAQYHDRAVWNASSDDEWFVPEPFDIHAPVDWLQASGLGRAANRLVAAACCLMWYECRPGEPEFARADTIGCASGATFDDALRRALLEWIERDATAIWWDNRLRRPGVRIESFEMPELDDVQRGLRAIGRDLFLLDCTTDIGIPAYVAVAPRFDGSEPLMSSAADPSPRIAAYRAASEAGQVWFEAMRSGALMPALRAWLLKESLATQPYLEPQTLVDAPAEPSAPALAAAPAPSWMPLVERLECVGLHAYAVDHSRADVLLRTVRAMVPGLRHVWKRRAPGRLYDVPIAMGWLERPLEEADLNPIPNML